MYISFAFKTNVHHIHVHVFVASKQLPIEARKNLLCATHNYLKQRINFQYRVGVSCPHFHCSAGTSSQHCYEILPTPTSPVHPFVTETLVPQMRQMLDVLEYHQNPQGHMRLHGTYIYGKLQ